MSERSAAAFDGVSAAELGACLAVPEVHLFAVVESTLDTAHRLAADGAAAGTLVLADSQTRGRGRSGRRWHSPPGSGIWLTLIERPPDAAGLQVLTLRLGLAVARALDCHAGGLVRIKWPNDLRLAAGKLAGLLVESRWRGTRLDWIVIGVGINVTVPRDVDFAAGLASGTSRLDALRAVVPAMRSAAADHRPTLSVEELRAFDERDASRGRACSAPAEGVVRGITSRAELVVATAAGNTTASSGSLVLVEEA